MRLFCFFEKKETDRVVYLRKKCVSNTDVTRRCRRRKKTHTDKNPNGLMSSRHFKSLCQGLLDK